MAETMELTRYGFTQEQADALQKTFGRKAEQGFDRPTLMWLIGGLTALGVAVAGAVWAEISSVRSEIGSVRSEIGSVRSEIGSVRSEIGSVRDEIYSIRDELREEIAANRAQIAELVKGQTRIMAILEERLPRNR